MNSEFIISNACTAIKAKGKLADVAPTILKMMQMEIPAEMDGIPLF